MAGPKVFFEDGSAVPDEQIHDAVTAGKAFVEQGASLNMLDDTGAPVRIAAENVPHALAAGYSVEGAASAGARQSRREHTTGGQMALASAEGVARGATLGLSDAALVGALGDDYRKGAQARQQENRLVSGAGEVAGAVGGSLLTGGLLGAASAPARGVAALGRATEGAVAGLVGKGAGVLGRAGARAAALGGAGAVEGSLYGAGQAVSKAALDGTQLSAEKVLASMGEGALLGGAGGAVLGGLAGGMQGAAGAVSKAKGIQQSARELANESALKAAGARGSDFRRIVGRRTGESAEKRIDELGQELLHYEYKTGPRQGQQLFRAAVKADDLVDDVVYARQETGEALGAIREKLDDVFAQRPELAPDVKRYLTEVDDQVLKPLKESKVPAIRARADKVEEQLSGLRERVEAADAIITAEPQRVRLPDGSIEMRPRVAPEPMTFRELEQVRRDLREVFQPPKSSAGGIPAQPPEHAAALEQAERLLSTHLDDSAEKAMAASGGDVTAYQGLKKQYSNLRDIEDLVQKADLQQAGNRAVSPSDYATGTGIGLGALLSGNVGAIGYGIAGAVAHKLIRERGRSTLAVLADSVANMNSGIDSAARRFAGAALDAPKRAVTPLVLGASEIASRYAGAVAAVQDFQTPEGGMARLQAPTQRFAAESPALAEAVQGQVGKAYAFMASKLPTVSSRAATSFTPDLTETRVPVPEMSKFLKYWRGVTAPGQVIDDLSSGKMDRAGLEAIKAVYPETFGELRSRVMTYAAERGDQLPFQQRILLSLVFDFPGDKSMTPAYAQDVQAAYQPTPEAPEQDSGRALSLSPKIGDDMQTETQRVAQR
jgi:hypothetical protein